MQQLTYEELLQRDKEHQQEIANLLNHINQQAKLSGLVLTERNQLLEKIDKIMEICTNG